MMRSSANLLRCTCSSAAQNESSTTKSRSETASIEFCTGRVKPRESDSASRSMPKGLPARAPQPSGHSFMRAAACSSRSASRFQLHACARSQCPQRMGCADCRCVYPGMMMSASAAARLAATWIRPRSRPPSFSHVPRRCSLTSVTTWSFRLRPVWTLPPAAPMSSVRRRSLAVWMSSSPSQTTKVPAAHSARMLSSPLRIDVPSSAESTPAASIHWL
mmetsp:Transcript_10554/g.24807  ORF Transcript_10554/g.24807 Transcript_10554/m.24807 type:complete len:218 (-) Transcript_10554:159-812(-)